VLIDGGHRTRAHYQRAARHSGSAPAAVSGPLTLAVVSREYGRKHDQNEHEAGYDLCD
jgi:hypothetical protein